jgi:UMF1 family MFS transporter
MDDGGAPESLRRIRATFLLAAGWYLIFALPLIFLVPDTRGQGKPLSRAVRDGFFQLVETLQQVRRFKPLALFLLARMIYIDALATIFALGGVYAAGIFGMSEQQVLLFGVVLNITAGIGAFASAPLDDRIGPRTTILIALAGLVTGAALILIVHTLLFFWLAGAFLGLFVGPVQSASRSYMARAAPDAMRHQMFGLYAFSGKDTAFLGPFMVGWLTVLFDSQRMGMGVIVVLLVIGGILMLSVPEADGPVSGQ